MKKIYIYAVLILIFRLIISINTTADMTSENYRIKISIPSGGGISTGSVNYQMNSTFGQSTPLMEAINPPMSDNYDLYPGFWYTLATGLMQCKDLLSFSQAFGTTNSDFNYNISCDSEPDGDIDGVDLSGFLREYEL